MSLQPWRRRSKPSMSKSTNWKVN